MFKLCNSLKLAVSAILLIVSISVIAATDTEITDEIKSKIQKIKTSAPISVTTADGVITLSGNVESQTVANEAIQAAFSVDGVKDVNTKNLLVQANPLAPANVGSQADQDAQITAKVMGIINRNDPTPTSSITSTANLPPTSTIHVETRNGVVYLSGKPDTLQKQTDLMYKIRTIEGVKNVESSVSKF